MLKRITQCAMAVGALAALALPAGVSATWVESTAVKTGSNPKISLTGKEIKFTSTTTGGVSCHMSAEIELTGGTTTGFMNKFEPFAGATTSCTESGIIALEGCVIETIQPTELPWVLHNNTPTLTVSVTAKTVHLELRKTVGGVSQPCPKFPGSDFTGGTLTLTPNSVALISSFNLSGTLIFDPGAVATTFSGTFNILAPNAEKYGL